MNLHGPDFQCAPCARGIHGQCAQGCSEGTCPEHAERRDMAAAIGAAKDRMSAIQHAELRAETTTGREALRQLERRYAGPWLP